MGKTFGKQLFARLQRLPITSIPIWSLWYTFVLRG